MTLFLRLLADADKATSLQEKCISLREGETDKDIFDVAAESFAAIPGSPFAYWVSEDIRNTFSELSAFESGDRAARVGLQSSDDFRFLRAWWETIDGGQKWFGFAKGGTHSPFYADISMQVNWGDNGAELKSWASSLYGSWSRIIKNTDLYLLPGLFQTLRAARLAPHLTPPGCIFSDNGTQAFSDQANLLPILALLNSSAADYLHKLLLGRSGYALYRNGTLARLPIPSVSGQHQRLATLVSNNWSKRRLLDEVGETSHAFVLPAALRARLRDYEPLSIEAELIRIQAEIDDIAFDLYGFSDADRAEVLGSFGSTDEDEGEAEEDAGNCQDDESAEVIDKTEGLLSWAVGVAFGRFDWRLATGEREAPPEPDPFDPLPAKSPGMLPDGAAPYHAHYGILVDDQGQPHDLPQLIEEVRARVGAEAPGDVRRWLQRDFFPLHLKQYSKSRRKAPIYWPLSTASGSYTLWLYYPSLTSQTLYTAVNDFIEGPNGKLQQVGRELSVLRDKGTARSRDDEKTFEALQTFELELIELRDTLLQIAPTYRPNHDDGIQITASPLWQLFRHKPWQKILKDTWAKLGKGDYDWAHLAMTYWPDRVREKCKTDKSLAIAHDLEDLYVEPEPKAPKTRGRKKGSDA
ncbi:type II restriction endonuclease subunit M [Taklimakanibacter deserti]|uniref:type II restriction endonuclease subunit M n=1 Tax=Taklimakanibacter deserti TaxID=2267839 RepID=UPI0013C4EC8E